ncbi:MAG: hypothetical protein II517_04230 [Ruminococcus sp.]|nr:hypothetical protein [Ruminococcus sp.]
MRYTKIPTDTFQKIQINAGVITDNFVPSTGVAAPYFATTGGITFATNPEYSDFGEDVDNCPKNTKELKRLVAVAPTLSGTAVTVDAAKVKRFMGAATIDTTTAGVKKIVPSMALNATNDFGDLWFIGDYSDENGEETGGGLAIHLINAFNTAGFQLTTTDKGKGQFAFEFVGHMSISAQTTLPFEVYILDPFYSLNVTSVAGATSGKTALTVGGYTLGTGEGWVYKTGATVALPTIGADLSSGWTSWNGSTEITATTGQDIVVAAVDANSKCIGAGSAKVIAKD